MQHTNSSEKWWFGSAVYHIYLRSFFDSNNDGIGDLQGVIDKLDYLAGKAESLGVNAIWISPFYPSPMADFGYDVSDYTAVDPRFGDLNLFDKLLAEAHSRDLKVIIDIIPNHTSDKHAWFKESASSRVNNKRDWYVWRDGKDTNPPNNWLSAFGGPAWKYHEPSGQYYLHSFSANQPDLNWDNPEVRRAVADVLRFWLDRGVDGIRLDAVNWLSKDPEFNDDRLNHAPEENNAYSHLRHIHSSGGPRLFEYLNGLIEVCAHYDNRFIVTEGYPDVVTSIGQETAYYLQFYKNLDYRHCAPFNFELIDTPWNSHQYQSLIDRFQAALLPDQPSIYTLGNHDKPRLTSRIGVKSARSAAVMLLCLPGMPFIYYGEELGAENSKEATDFIDDHDVNPQGFKRQKYRSPMQWSPTPNAGFTHGQPWLPPADNYKDTNVEVESNDPKSSLSLYRNLLKLRTETPALKVGGYSQFSFSDEVLSFCRSHNAQKVLVLVNFSPETIILKSGHLHGRLMLSSHLDNYQPSGFTGSLELRPHEAVIIEASAET